MPRIRVERVPSIPYGGKSFLDAEDISSGADTVIVWLLESVVSAEEAQATELDMQTAVDDLLKMYGGPGQ